MRVADVVVPATKATMLRAQPASDGPSEGGHRLQAANVAEMSFHLFEFNPVAEHLYLVIGAAQMMKNACRVLIRQISCQVPHGAVNGWKTRRSPRRVV
jgi:hypothetical protein